MAQKMPDHDTYTAKQIATRIGTDAKTLRKFFRSPHSTVTAVGFGGRYEFDKEDLPKIAEEFKGWQSKSKRGRPKVQAAIEEIEEVEELDDEDLELDLDPEFWNTGGDDA